MKLLIPILLFISQLSFSQYILEPVRLPNSINKENWISSYPLISKDGSILIFRRTENNRKKSGFDYFWIKKDGNNWGEPKAIEILGNIGTGKFSDLHTLIDFDGVKLYFYNNDKGNRAGYSLEFKDEKFLTPVLIPDSIFSLIGPRVPTPKKHLLSTFSSFEENSIISDGPLLFIRNGDTYGPPIQISFRGFENEMTVVLSFSEVTKEIFFESPRGLHFAKLTPDLATQIDDAIQRNSPRSKTIQNEVEDQKKEKIEPSLKYRALLIAIDDYQNNDANLRDLENPISDAESFKKELIDNYRFNAENVTILRNPKREDIINSFENLSSQVTEKDNLLIFYGGHGDWDDKLNIGYWLASNATTESKGNWISNSTIRDYIAGLNTNHTLLISDACFSGSIFKTREIGNSIDDYGFYRLNKLPSRKAMTSGTLNTVPDDSKFMKYLLKVLSTNESTYLTSAQLFHEINTAVVNNTSNIPQFGTIQNTGDEGGDFIFIRKNREQ